MDVSLVVATVCVCAVCAVYTVIVSIIKFSLWCAYLPIDMSPYESDRTNYNSLTSR